MSRRLVIDACVLRAAGTTEDPVSINCREFLEAVLRICHKAVVCEELDVEYRRHRSRLSTRWSAAMASKGKWLPCDPDESFEEALAEVSPDASFEEEVRKDAHLVDAAFASDALIVSMDEKLHRRLSICAKDISQLTHLTWANPHLDAPETLAWLEAGARSDPKMKVQVAED